MDSTGERAKEIFCYVAINEKTGKFFRSRDRDRRDKPETWAGGSWREARHFKDIRSAEASLTTTAKDRKEVKIPFCRICNEPRPDDHNFCYECGVKIPIDVKINYILSLPKNVKILAVEGSDLNLVGNLQKSKSLSSEQCMDLIWTAADSGR